MTSDSTAPVGSRRWRNWSGNQRAGTVDVLAPGSLDEVAALVKGMPFSVVNHLLAARGPAVPDLGDIDAQTGAISTGTKTRLLGRRRDAGDGNRTDPPSG